MTARQSPELPDTYPEWAREFGELYFSGTTSMFALHGNTQDLVHYDGRFLPLTEFASDELFAKWDLVLYYDLSTGLRVLGGTDPKRQSKMAAVAAKKIGDLSSIGKDPLRVLHVLNRFMEKNVMADPANRVSVALILNHASFLARRGKSDTKTATNLVTLLNWATSPYVKKLNTAFVLIDSTLSDMSERITSSASCEVKRRRRSANAGGDGISTPRSTWWTPVPASSLRRRRTSTRRTRRNRNPCLRIARRS